jgi:hypothetical protein
LPFQDDSAEAVQLNGRQIPSVPVTGTGDPLLESANLTGPTLAEVIDQAHKGIERVRRTRT